MVFKFFGFLLAMLLFFAGASLVGSADPVWVAVLLMLGCTAFNITWGR